MAPKFALWHPNSTTRSTTDIKTLNTKETYTKANNKMTIYKRQQDVDIDD